MSADQTPKPKIIVDSDWKERVQAEKEAFKNEAADAATESSPGQPQSSQQLPPASFSLLVTTLVTEALAALGQIPLPEQQEQLVRLDVARHHIDMLDMLEDKTRGNLTSDESLMLSNVLHELRMLFVTVQTQSATQPPPGPVKT